MFWPIWSGLAGEVMVGPAGSMGTIAGSVARGLPGRCVLG